jgi:hypothetical protein
MILCLTMIITGERKKRRPETEDLHIDRVSLVGRPDDMHGLPSRVGCNRIATCPAAMTDQRAASRYLLAQEMMA